MHAAVSWDFKAASESDTIWERFLPSDYQEIISNCVGPPLNYATKKELFFSLCNFPIIINDGKLSFGLSKSSGKKCYMLSARALWIIWGETPDYWIWKSMPESRLSEVAELINVCWFHIQGGMQTQMLSLKTTYAAYLVFKLTEDSYGLDVVAKSSVISTNSTIDQIELELVIQPEPGAHIHDRRVPQQRRDGWMEMYLGEFYNDEGEGNIEMKLWETSFLNWKKGLILQGIEVRPKEEDA